MRKENLLKSAKKEKDEMLQHMKGKELDRIDCETVLQISLLRIGMEKGYLTKREREYIQSLTPVVDMLRKVRLMTKGMARPAWDNLQEENAEQLINYLKAAQENIAFEWMERLRREDAGEQTAAEYCKGQMEKLLEYFCRIEETEYERQKKRAEEIAKEWMMPKEDLVLTGGKDFSYIRGRNDLLQGTGGYNYVRDGLQKYARTVVYLETDKGSGSGVIFGRKGYVVTCAHVVKDADEVKVMIRGREEFVSGQVAAFLEELDLAVVQIANEEGIFAELGDLEGLPDPGEDIVLLGYPFGTGVCDDINQMNLSFTRGYVSSNQVREGINRTLLDISAKGGNSGSPVISGKSGKVIGILNGSIVRGEGRLVEEINFMTPIQYLKSCI